MIQYARLIWAEAAKSPIREIDSSQLLLGFVLKPDVIRESIWVPHFRLITICLSYLCERRPRFNLKESTVVLVIAERDKVNFSHNLPRSIRATKSSPVSPRLRGLGHRKKNMLSPPKFLCQTFLRRAGDMVAASLRFLRCFAWRMPIRYIAGQK